MEKKRTTKVLAILAILIAIAGMSISFDSFSTKLDINGYASMGNANWHIYFDNLSSAEVKGEAEEITHPTITNNSTSIGTYYVKLNRPNDSISYTFDIVNAGGLDAKLTTLNMPKPICVGSGANKEIDEKLVCDHLKYTLTKLDGSTYSLADVIKKEERLTVKLTLTYEGDTLPNEEVKIEGLGIDLNYSQN